MSNAPDTARMAELPAAKGLQGGGDRRRLALQINRHLDIAGRIIRNLGAPADELEDLLQQAFSIMAARLGDIVPGKERSFLIETAIRLAASARRRQARSREIATGELPEVPDAAPSPEDLTDRTRALQLLDRILDQMDDDLRSVFVLFEVEEMTMAEIATLLDLPSGTVASRLRRAREQFGDRVRRAQMKTPEAKTPEARKDRP
jgi:RNA polymerase sigma-70 factor (ECF subfamily)